MKRESLLCGCTLLPHGGTAGDSRQRGGCSDCRGSLRKDNPSLRDPHTLALKSSVLSICCFSLNTRPLFKARASPHLHWCWCLTFQTQTPLLPAPPIHLGCRAAFPLEFSKHRVSFSPFLRPFASLSTDPTSSLFLCGQFLLLHNYGYIKIITLAKHLPWQAPTKEGGQI